MAENTLKKATGRGFTVIPNHLIDALMATANKHTSDSLALALYLVRHIPAQSGTLSLAGDFSQGRICEDLGWGPTNRARLKRAISDLEQTGAVKSQLYAGNTVVLTVEAELHVKNLDRETVREIRPPNDSLHHPRQPTKNPLAPPLKDFSSPKLQNSHSMAGLSTADSLKSNKEIKQNKHHHPSESLRDNQPRTVTEKDDDDVDQLLRLYRHLFKQCIAPSVALNFAQAYWKNDRPFDFVKNGFEELANHPILRLRTTSPNAVWELAFMRKKASEADARFRQTIENLRYHLGSDEDCLAQITSIMTHHKLNAEVFSQFYRADIDSMLAHRAKDRAEKLQWELEDRCELPSEREMPQTLSVPDLVQNAQQASLPDVSESSDESIVPQALEAEPKLADPVCPIPQTPATTTGMISPLDSVQISIKNHHQSSSHRVSSRASDRLTKFNPQLNQARTKRELMQIIVEAYKAETNLDERGPLETLIQLANLDSISFERLRSLIAAHMNSYQEVA